MISKLDILLKDKSKKSNTLVYELLQSQNNLSKEEALEYIFQFQIQNFWSKEISSYYFELDEYIFNIYFEEESEMHLAVVYLICSISTPTKGLKENTPLINLKEKKYIGSFGYGVTLNINFEPFLLEHRNSAIITFKNLIQQLTI